MPVDVPLILLLFLGQTELVVACPDFNSASLRQTTSFDLEISCQWIKETLKLGKSSQWPLLLRAMSCHCPLQSDGSCLCIRDHRGGHSSRCFPGKGWQAAWAGLGWALAGILVDLVIPGAPGRWEDGATSGCSVTPKEC